MTVHTVVPQCVLSVLSYSEQKMDKTFWGIAPGPNWRQLTVPPEFPAAQHLFSSLRSSKNRHPKKIAGYSTVVG